MQDSDDPRFRQAPAQRRAPGRPTPRRAPRPAPPPAAETGLERLQKVLADAGVASRRDCELAILAGRVRVNGRPVHALPCLVRPHDDLIEFDGEIIDTDYGPAFVHLERFALDHQLLLATSDEELAKRASRERWHVLNLEGRQTGQSTGSEEKADAGQMHLL